MNKQYTIIVMLTASPDWLRLSRQERAAFTGREVAPIVAKYADKVRLHWLDAEAFNARCSDVALFETGNLQDYYFLMEALRDTALFSQPYFKVEEIVVGLEDGYRKYEAAQS